MSAEPGWMWIAGCWASAVLTAAAARIRIAMERPVVVFIRRLFSHQEREGLTPQLSRGGRYGDVELSKVGMRPPSAAATGSPPSDPIPASERLITQQRPRLCYSPPTPAYYVEPPPGPSDRVRPTGRRTTSAVARCCTAGQPD